jgi:hypothetical protein
MLLLTLVLLPAGSMCRLQNKYKGGRAHAGSKLLPASCFLLPASCPEYTEARGKLLT